MKLHKNLCEAVAGGIEQVFAQGAHTSQVVEKLLLSNKKWGARDRNFIAGYIYTCVRYYRLYSDAAGLPEVTSTHEGWLVLGACLISEGIDLPVWEEWSALDTAVIKERLEKASHIRQIRESIPDWLDERAAKELGAGWDAELHALNQPAPLCIRVNTLRATKESVAEFLRTEEMSFSEAGEAPDAFILDTKKNLRTSYAYRSGWFEVQDVSSQQVAPMLDIRPDMTVIDACAGAGGKTLHIAALMAGHGRIIAMDTHVDKLKELASRSRRNGAEHIQHLLYTDGMEHQYIDRADRLLLDVPCSGTGVIKRHPDTKWKLTPDTLDELISLQRSLLHRYSIMVRPGGIMVYATCSILPSENEEQVNAFLAKHPDFKKTAEKKILPSSGYDGFYIVQLSKN